MCPVPYVLLVGTISDFPICSPAQLLVPRPPCRHNKQRNARSLLLQKVSENQDVYIIHMKKIWGNSGEQLQCTFVPTEQSFHELLRLTVNLQVTLIARVTTCRTEHACTLLLFIPVFLQLCSGPILHGMLLAGPCAIPSLQPHSQVIW